MITRRKFIGCATIGSLTVLARAKEIPAGTFMVQTVLGPIPATQLGVTLPHEHVMCDFIGADKTGRHRWDVEVVVQRMEPFLRQLKERGVTGFIDCTPAYIGRDPRVLRRLAKKTGLHIVTNTGYYGGAMDKFVPQHAYAESAEQLAERWIHEWENGIEGSGVKPGFIKIGVDEHPADPNSLSAIDDKIVRASAWASRQTGLPVVCHTGGGPAGLAATRIFITQKGDANRFMVAHSDRHGLPINQQIADLGAWISFDAISRHPVEEHLELVKTLIESHAENLLLSHDNGWFSVGDENGGEVRDFNFLTDEFLPTLLREGVHQTVVDQLTIHNPRRAFGLDPV